MTTACYVVWNEEQHIAESIRSIRAYVDRIVVVDGAFSTNPGGQGPSTDNTEAIVERAAGTTSLDYIVSTIPLQEQEASNLALAQLEVGDWALIIDGDEVLYGDFNLARAPIARQPDVSAIALRVYTTAVLFDGNADQMGRREFETNPVITTVGWQPRFFRKTKNTKFTRLPALIPAGSFTHTNLFRGEERVNGVQVEGVFLINRHVSQSLEGYLADYAWETAQRDGAQ